MKAPKSWLTQFINLNGVSNLDFAERMTFAGNKVDSLQKINHDTIFDFEVTSNRPDTLSIIGLAREASAIFTRPLKLPKAPKLSSLKNNPISFNVSDQKLCPTYSLVEVAKVKVKPASKLIQSRLKLSGVETVNNIVDVTNYLMLETGQPMHAFNADKIHGPLTLRAAKQGEKIIPLDHKQRTLLGGEIIIEDKEKLVDLAGLMGGLNTEISSQTTRVLLLVPIYDPVSIRRASKNLGLRTEASLRFEKKLDLTQTPEVALRAVKLLEKETRGRQTTAILTHKATFKSPSIRLDARDASFRLGVTLSQNQIDDCLKPLAIKKTTSGYQPPPWRRDLAEPVDLIEEVARIFGYNKFPKTMPSGVIPTHPDALAPNWLRLIRNAVAALGFTETYRDTLIGQDTITSLGLKPQTHLKVLHPMSKDYEYMRSTLMENLIPSLVFNLGHSQNIKLFELGTVFYPTQSSTILPDQPTELGLVATPSDFRYFKGEMEFLLKSLNLEVSLIRAKKKQPFFHPQNQATVFLEQSPVGKLGEILPPLLPLDTPPAYGLTLNITKLMPHLSLGHSYPPQYPYPPFIEDYTFMLPPKTPIGHVLDDILATSKLVERANLKTIFRQNYTFTIHFRDPQKSLSDQDVTPIRKKIVENLTKHFSTKLIGQVKQ